MNICKVYRYLRLEFYSAQNHKYMQGVQVLAAWNMLSTEPWIYARCTGTCILKYTQLRTMNICKVYRYLRLEIYSAQNHEYMQGVQVLASWNILSTEPWIYMQGVQVLESWNILSLESWIYARCTGTCGLEYAQHRTMNICKVYRYLHLQIYSAQNHEYMQGVQVLAAWNMFSTEPWIYARYTGTCGLKYAQHRTMNICKVYRYLRLEIYLA